MSKSNGSFPVFDPPEEFELVLEFEVAGQPARKSNSRRIVTNRKTKQPMLIKSEAALNYTDEFLRQVPGNAKLGLGSLEEPLLLWAIVYYKSNQPDLSVELIKDLLEEAGVVRNDRYIRGELLFGKVDRDSPRTIIRLYRMPNGD
jgi:Holliday junction resolvase RusA-like endonuclease